MSEILKEGHHSCRTDESKGMIPQENDRAKNTKGQKKERETKREREQEINEEPAGERDTVLPVSELSLYSRPPL